MKKKIIMLISFLSITVVTAQGNKKDINSNYRRSSLYTILMDEYSHPYSELISNFFKTIPLSEKFNNHNLNSRILEVTEKLDWKKYKKFHQNNNDFLFTGDGGVKYEKKSISDYLEKNNVAKDLVAKWFNRSEKGGFNMKLIQSRGNYDASLLDVALAKATKRGISSLKDDGEELIQNTFVLVYDSHFVYDFFRNELEASALRPQFRYFAFGTRAHLYQLIWNEEMASKFYNDYWADDKTITPTRKKAFDESNLFKLKYMGSDKSMELYQKTFYSNAKLEEFTKNENVILGETAYNAMDAAMVRLQRNHDEFKTKTVLYTNPLSAKIGLKEGLNKKSIFDVLEQSIDENGKTKFKVIGSVKIDSSFPIWDNRYPAGEEKIDDKNEVTYFVKVSGSEFYPGMLLVQKKGK